MRNLILMRHGEAEAFTKAGDSLRQLTQRGRRDASTAGSFLLANESGYCNPLATVSSPYIRANQTREVVEKTLSQGGRRIITEQDSESITPDASRDQALSLIEALNRRYTSILLVTHQPLISRLLAWFVDGEWSSGGNLPSMMPASLCWLRSEILERGCCHVHTDVHPYTR